jgi:hypothetical protein
MRSNTENAIDEGPLTTFVLQRQTVFESDRPFRRFPKKKLNENASLEWTAKSPNLQQQDISELWDTMEMLEQPVPHRGRKRPQPKHTVSDSDSVATTGYQGSHQSTSADDSDSDSVTTTGYPISNQSTSTVDAAEDRKFGGHLASQRELCEPGMNGEPLDRSFPVLAGQSQESSSRVAASGEKKQKCVSDSTTTTQSLELTDPQSDEVNPLNATSGVKGKASNGLSISGGGTPQLPETDASPPVPSAAISLRRRLTGALKGVQPVHIASRHSVTQIPIQTVEARLIGKNCYLALKEEVHKSLAERWNESIHQRLRQNVEAVIQGMGLQPTEMAVNVGLSLVGPKVGEMLHLLPTIVISCAHKKAKTKIEGLLNSGQLDYLREFACPHEVCIQGRDPKHRDRFFAHTDSSEEVDPLGEDISPYDLSLQRQKFLKFAVEQVTELRSACGLKIQFSYSIQDEHHDDYFGSEMSEHKRWMTARIGGNIYIGEKAFAMTTAHTFLFHELGEESDASSGSDSISGGNLDTKFDRQRPDHNANSIQAKTTLRMERGRLHGCFGFCDHGRRFDRQDLIPKLPGSDWCILSIDSINSLTNCYRTENEAGDVSEVTVDEIGPGEIAEPGDVHILNSPEKPILAFMTQTMASIYFGGKSLNVRRLISERPLSTGLSGSWVVRGKQLLGHLIGGNELEKTMYMLGIQDTKRAIEQVTGGKMCLKPTNSAEVFVEEHPQLDRPEPAPRISNVWYEDPKTGDIYQDRIDSSNYPRHTSVVSSNC